MNIEALDRDEELRRREFPVARKRIFLAHAGVCPLPARVGRAMQEYLELAQTGDQEKTFYGIRIHETRELGARLLGCHSDEIALVGPTSVGLSLVAGGLSWSSGDEVICYQDDYPANVYVWMALKRRGVNVRFVRPQRLGAITADDVRAQMTDKTKLVSLSSVHFLSGHRLDVTSIGQLCREKKIYFCLDAIQSIGALDTPLDGVDFLAADAHKWMLGPLAAGIVYVRRGVQEQLSPALVGWANAACPGFVAQDELIFPPNASRYEAGSHNLTGIVGLHACMNLLLETGVAAIERRLLDNSRFLREALRERGWQLLGDDKALSGSVSFFKPGADMEPRFNELTKKGIVASLRVDRTGQQYIRFSPHFYNTRAELEVALEAAGRA